MTDLVISDAARADLREVVDYIARDNPERAETFLDGLLARISAVAEHPHAYPVRTDWPVPVRAAVRRRYLIVFREHEQRVEIARVLHSARDIPAILRDQ
jgi:toxin ParE1/3/4